MPRLSLSFFGAFRAELDGVPLTHFRSARVRGLLAYLAVELGFPHPRDSLSALLWPDAPDEVARQNLRQALYQLRTVLGDERPTASAPFLLITRQTVQFNRESDHQLDVAEFLAALSAKQPERAVYLYQGDLLAGLHCDSAPFEEWQAVIRERLHRLALDALRQLAGQCQERGEYSEARKYLERLLALEPWAEDGHRQLMWVLAQSGQRGAALAQYKTCRRVLLAELGVAPGSETSLLYEQIKQGQEPLQRGAPAPRGQARPLESVPARPAAHGLPPQVSPLIGRERELEEISRQLADPQCRLLTLVGLGGSGKTRLAISVAHQEAGRQRYRQGVHFVSLAGLPARPITYAAPGEVEAEAAVTIAQSLDLSLLPQPTPVAQLVRWLREKHLLLVLDNWEHILPAAGLLSGLWAAAPGLHMLVTSREPLNLQEEWLYWVPGLNTPQSGETADLEHYDSVRLFVQSARRVRPGFRLQADNQRAIAHICRLVEGLPLAIELATAWLRGMSCDELAVEIERGLDVLTSPLRDAPERHRSLRAAFETSWQMLAPKEQRLLARLSVFQGDFSRAAARAVVDASLLELTTLVAKSLLAHTDPERYALHELVRQFAAEKLALTEEEALQARRQHSAYYLGFVARRATMLYSRESRLTSAQIWRELDNVRQAWRSAIDTNWLELLGHAQEGLAAFYHFAGLTQEHEEMFARAITRARAVPTATGQHLLSELLALHARVLAPLDRCDDAIQEAQEAIHLGQLALNLKAQVIGYLAWGATLMHLFQPEAALVPLEQAVALAQSASLPNLEAPGRWQLATAAIGLGDLTRAQAELEAALRLCRETGNRQVEAMVTRELGLVAQEQGDYDLARRRCEQSVQLAREIGFRGGEGPPLGNLGNIAVLQGDYVHAQIYYQQVIELSRETGQRHNQSLALGDLSDLALRLGDLPKAESLCQEALRLCREAGNRVIESRNLATLARIYHHLGRDEEARQVGLQAEAIALAEKTRSEQALALTSLGHALLGLARAGAGNPASFAEASEVYRRASELWQAIGKPDQAMEALAGLAETHLAGGDIGLAQAHIEPVLIYLENHPLDHASEPAQVRLTCYRVLRANHDSRASSVLLAAQARLQEQAAKITDIELRRSFLENVPAHQAISFRPPSAANTRA